MLSTVPGIRLELNKYYVFFNLNDIWNLKLSTTFVHLLHVHLHKMKTSS